MKNKDNKILDLSTGQPVEDLEFLRELEDVDDDDWYEGHGTELNKDKWKLFQQIAKSFNDLIGKDKAIAQVRHSNDPYPFSNTEAVHVTFPVVSAPDAATRKVIADAINACDRFCIFAGDRKVTMSFSVRDIWKDFDYKDGLDINPKIFPSIEKLHFVIWKLVSRFDAYDAAAFDCDAVALYLSWFNLTDEQIKAYRKADVLDDGIMVNGKKEALPPDILKVFLRLRDSKGYSTATSKDGVIFHAYEKSDRLIRSVGK